MEQKRERRRENTHVRVLLLAPPVGVLMLAALAVAASCTALRAATYMVFVAVAAVATPYCICETSKKTYDVRDFFVFWLIFLKIEK
jgi:hypothetical protein